jgi:hypothetical protein
MRNSILAGLGIVLLGGAGTLGLLSGDKGGDVGPGDVDPVAIVETLRPAMLPGACPSSVATDAPKCKQQVQMDSGCLCLTAQDVGAVDGEMESADDMDSKDRNNLTVCCDKGKAKVLRLPVAQETPIGCTVIGQPTQDFTIGSMETDFTKMMSAACAPCVGFAQCPQCICDVGGCAATCKASEVESIE